MPAITTVVNVTERREKMEATLHHWQRILEDAKQFRGTHEVHAAQEQIRWIRGYLRALDDLINASQ